MLPPSNSRWSPLNKGTVGPALHAGQVTTAFPLHSDGTHTPTSKPDCSMDLRCSSAKSRSICQRRDRMSESSRSWEVRRTSHADWSRCTCSACLAAVVTRLSRSRTTCCTGSSPSILTMLIPSEPPDTGLGISSEGGGDVGGHLLRSAGLSRTWLACPTKSDTRRVILSSSSPSRAERSCVVLA